MTILFKHTTQRAGAARRLATATLLLAAVAACSPDEILTVEDIDVARPISVQDSAALQSVLAGAIGNFGVMYNGGGDFNQVTLSGLLSDEFINTETFPTRIEVDQRRQQYQSNGSLSNAFYAIQQARAAADFSANAWRKYAPTEPGLAESLNLASLAISILSENYCGAVPLSREKEDGTFEFGPNLSTAELSQRAIVKADSALLVVGTSTTAAGQAQARLARIAKARALLDLNRPAEAAAAIGGETGVPTTFQYIYRHSETTGRQNNGTWGQVQNSGRFGVADREGTNGLPYQSEGDTARTTDDPRVINARRPTNSGNGFDNATPMWWQLKYPLRASSIVIADGVEARLIEAEAAQRAGNYAGALTILNALRSNAALLTLRGYPSNSLAPLAPAVGATAEVDQIFKERAYWLFLTSHRLGDLRRLIRQYGRANEAVFPTGAYHKPGTYGTDVNSPIPQAEDNNPNFNRSACVTSQA